MTTNENPCSEFLPDGQKWFTAKEAAYALGRSPQYVRNCFDSGQIMGHLMGTGEVRRSFMIPRYALELYLLETANYNSRDMANRLLRLARRLSPELRTEVANRLSN